jgi:hypothetical protein
MPIVDLPRVPIEETWCIETIRGLLDHPWIRQESTEVEAQPDRLESAIERAARHPAAMPSAGVACRQDAPCARIGWRPCSWRSLSLPAEAGTP